MGQLHEASAVEKDAATRVQITLLKQVDILRKSQSPRTGEERVWAPPSPQRYSGAVHTTGSLKCNRSETHNNDVRSKNSEYLRSLKFLRIEEIADLVQKWLNQVSKPSPKGMEYSGLRPSDSPLSMEITML